MKLTLFGATGLLGRECLAQALEAGHEVTALVRTPSKLPPGLREQITVVEGDGLDPAAVERALSADTDAVLFAIGIDNVVMDARCPSVVESFEPNDGETSTVHVSHTAVEIGEQDELLAVVDERGKSHVLRVRIPHRGNVRAVHGEPHDLPL